jgi:hypothetical protein
MGAGVPHQPDHHPGDAGAAHCPRPQAPQDGQGDPRPPRHSHAGSPSGTTKAVNREVKLSRRYRDRDLAKFESSRRYRER